MRSGSFYILKELVKIVDDKKDANCDLVLPIKQKALNECLNANPQEESSRERQELCSKELLSYLRAIKKCEQLQWPKKIENDFEEVHQLKPSGPS